MARPATGQVVERERAGDRVFALRFRAYGKRRYLTLGTASEGWSRPKAEQELENVLADVRRGLWQPHQPEPVSEPTAEPTFHVFASEWFESIRRELRPNSIAAYQWEITYHLLPFFKDHRLSEITIPEVDRYRQHKVTERDRLRDQRAEQAKLPAPERAKLPRPLANETINKTIVRLGQILDVAVEYGYLPANPAKGKRRKLRTTRPARSYLDSAGQIAALLEAAGELDGEAREDRQHVPRRATVATLVFAGLRIGELLELRWRDVDLAGGWLSVGQAKTDAGARKVKVRPALGSELRALKVTTARSGAESLVFGTAAGKRQHPGNVRTRTLSRALTRANERLAHRGEPPLPAVTPHGLRRSFASLLYAIGEPPPVVMAEMGHTDPALALAIYAQAMRRNDDENERLRALIGGGDWAPLGTSGAADGPETALQIGSGHKKTTR